MTTIEKGAPQKISNYFKFPVKSYGSRSQYAIYKNRGHIERILSESSARKFHLDILNLFRLPS